MNRETRAENRYRFYEGKIDRNRPCKFTVMTSSGKQPCALDNYGGDVPRLPVTTIPLKQASILGMNAECCTIKDGIWTGRPWRFLCRR